MGRKGKVFGAAVVVGLVAAAVQRKRARDQREGRAVTPLRQRAMRLMNRTDLSGLYETLQLVASKVRRNTAPAVDEPAGFGEYTKAIRALDAANWPLSDLELVAGAHDTYVYVTTPSEVVKIRLVGNGGYHVDSFGPTKYNQTPMAGQPEQPSYEQFRKIIDESAGAAPTTPTQG